MKAPISETSKEKYNIETYIFKTEEQKKQAIALYERIERQSFPFLCAPKCKLEESNILHVTSEAFTENIEEFILQKVAFDDQKLLGFAAQGLMVLANIIMTGFDQNKENELHPYFEKYDKDGIIKSIYEDGILNGS
ncbi:MAG: hypothetical protein EZS28_054769, partial [Streblomastix strix]